MKLISRRRALNIFLDEELKIIFVSLVKSFSRWHVIYKLLIIVISWNFREIHFTEKTILTCHNIEISILALIIRMRRLFTRMFVVGSFLNFRVLCVESSIWICMHLSYMVRKTNQRDWATIRSTIWTRKIFPFNRFFGWWSYPMGFIQVIICRFEILPEK